MDLRFFSIFFYAIGLTPALNPQVNLSTEIDCNTIRSSLHPRNDVQIGSILCNLNRQDRITMKNTCQGIDKELEALDPFLNTLLYDFFQNDWDIYLTDLHGSIVGDYYAPRTVIEILLTVDADKEKFINDYKEKFNSSMADDMKAHYIDDMKQLLLELHDRQRRKTATFLETKLEAQLLIDEIIEWEYNRTQLNRILMETPIPILTEILNQFNLIYDEKLEHVVNRVLTGDIRMYYKDIITFLDNRAKYYAEILNDALEGNGVVERTLNRIIIIHADEDLKAILDSYQKLYPFKKSPTDQIVEDFMLPISLRDELLCLLGLHNET